MDILYFGTVCDPQHYEKILTQCKYKPTIATVVFESALLEGFYQNGSDMEVHSFPMIPMYPKSPFLSFGGFSEKLPCGYDCHWLKTRNIPFLKQWSRRRDARKVLKNWCKDHAGRGVILSYSIPPFMAGDMLRFGRKYGIKSVAIVPDLPMNMYQNHKSNRLIHLLKQQYLKGSIRNQGAFDAYIYLTDAMADVIAPGKPYMVMEGIWKTDELSVSERKASQRAIMYAGMLHEKYGVLSLVEAFLQADLPSIELWLFGDGTALPTIQKIAAQDHRIKCFGRVSREEILRKEREATLLVNPRNVNDVFTKYSFPSKTIEYMSSGTAVLTTRLEGIPKEYFDYVYSVENSSSVELRDALTRILHLSDDELICKGKSARNFIVQEKNPKSQCGRIIKFLDELCGVRNEDSYKEKVQ